MLFDKSKTIVEVTSVVEAAIAKDSGFNNIWLGGLTNGLVNGFQDNGSFDPEELLILAEQILARVEGINIFVDYNDKCPSLESFSKNIYLVIEDTTGPKKNSFDNKTNPLEDVDKFIKKLSKAKDIGYKVIPRFEGIIIGQNEEEIINRINQCSIHSDLVFIHSNETFPLKLKNVLENVDKKIVVCPTTYLRQTSTLSYDYVVLANQFTRARLSLYKNMLQELDMSRYEQMDLHEAINFWKS